MNRRGFLSALGITGVALWIDPLRLLAKEGGQYNLARGELCDLGGYVEFSMDAFRDTNYPWKLAEYMKEAGRRQLEFFYREKGFEPVGEIQWIWKVPTIESPFSGATFGWKVRARKI